MSTQVWEQTQADSEDRMHSMAPRGSSTEEWANIQERAFTAWVNKHLAKRNVHIANLQELRTGVRLIQLVEVLSGKSLGKYSQTSQMRIHHLDNTDRALRFLTQDEGLTLVNTGASDVVDDHREIVLGLIWSLIQKYELRLNRAELLGWARDMVSAAANVRVNNFGADWNSGKALCALVESCSPGTFGKLAALHVWPR